VGGRLNDAQRLVFIGGLHRSEIDASNVTRLT
jgi:hypothetical protein